MNPDIKRDDEMNRQNRTVYTIMALSLIVLGILISISVISARRFDNRNVLSRDTDDKIESSDNANELERPAAAIVTDIPDVTDAPSTEGESESEAPSETEPTDAVPNFIPVAIGCVTKGFSYEIPVYSATMGDYRVHSGIDIAVPVGSDVFAAAAGTVSAVWEDPLGGCAMRIEHSGGAVSTYYNLSPETLCAMHPGMAVSRGDVIATVGDTTLIEIADEAHVHYELTIGGEFVDPCAYVSYPATEPSYEG